MRRILTALFVVAVGTASTASAQVIFNGGAPNQAGGNEMTQWVQYNDFQLAAAQTITEIDFWSINTTGLFDGSVSWIIAANNGGVPGTGLFNGSATANVTNTGNTGVLGIFNETLNKLAVNVSLGAGTYWLGLHNGPLTNTSRDEYYWEDTNAGFGAAGQEDIAPFGDGTSSNGADHAFQLIGGNATSTVPEPASMSLMAVGLTGLVGAARKRIRKA